MIKYIFICLFIVSCNNVSKNNTKQTTVPVIYKTIPKDTLISYKIEGISTEGAESKVSYINGKISVSTTYLFRGTGQSSVAYYFEKERIKVLEKHYYYKTGIENVQSDKDMVLDKELNYYIDFNGNLVGDMIQGRTDIFQEFKKEIPFKIN